MSCLAARSEEALEEICADIGPNAAYVAADVGKEEDLQRVAELARARFGSFDTWVNNAGVSIYGRLLDIPIEDQRKLFETNFWGVVYGSRIACQYLRGHGGALINIGSTVSDRAVPLQGIYSASKHAVKGFTDALRMELEEENSPISVTLIKPAGIATPYIDHAKNYMDRKPSLPPPVYAPENVAEAILHAAETPVRDLFVGSGGKGMSAMGHYAPRLMDKYMESSMFESQKREEPEERPSRRSIWSYKRSPRTRTLSGPRPGDEFLYQGCDESGADRGFDAGGRTSGYAVRAQPPIGTFTTAQKQRRRTESQRPRFPAHPSRARHSARCSRRTACG